ncbi:MAG: hypothetical protein M1821_005552 [Bathelium mastoideum]|nr:MAG: hypothetical protein M1821_005552 [Bathelium mastoideum]
MTTPSRQTGKAFFNYGTNAARHWLLALLLPVAVGVVLCYPALFLYYDNPARGTSNLPHHVWTSARLHAGSQAVPPDIEMRQMWIYGSYMKVLDRDIIKRALKIQNFVLGIGAYRDSSDSDDDGFGDPAVDYGKLNLSLIPLNPKAGALTWGYHSPLMYWNCSMSQIEKDQDFLATINRQAHKQSFMNLTMRPSSVFAGKTFDKNNLTAADALVLTFFNDPKLGVGEQWEKRMKRLADYSSDRWSLFPASGKITQSKLYDFRFQPMSINDDFALGVAYSMMAVYVMVILRRIRAVKSTFGLVVAVLVQTAASICASFTLCAIMGFNLSQIPRAVYPFVVLVIGLENTFRLINNVLSYPLEMPVIFRIANALGDVGHLTLAAVTFNLMLLWVLSHVFSPDVASFCAFAAVALVIDFLFHLTFFLAVLSVDVKRMELQDSLDRANKAQSSSSSTRSSPERNQQFWKYVLALRPFPISTRIFGSAAIVSFVSLLNWHFFDWESQTRTLKQMVGLVPRETHAATADAQMALPQYVGQTRTPAAWLRMQEYHTAKEVISVIRPNSYNLLARVYDPLMIVLSGADRSEAAAEKHTWLHKAHELVDEHVFTFIAVLLISVGFVVVLLRCMLYNELPEVENLEDVEDSFLTVKDLPKSHRLDIIKLAACGRGQMASVGLDRSTCIWSFDSHTLSFSHYALPNPETSPFLWPIITSAVDDTGTYFALYCLDGVIAVWSIAQHRFIGFSQLGLKEQPCHFSFKLLRADTPSSLRLLVVTTDGLLTELDFQIRHQQTVRLCDTFLTSVAVFDSAKKTPLRLVAISKSGCMHVAYRPQSDWIVESICPFGSDMSQLTGQMRVRSIVSAPAINILAAKRSCQVSLLNLESVAVVHTFQIGQAKAGSLRVLHSLRRKCLSCGGPAIYSFSAAYTESETGKCIMHTFTASDGQNASICLQSTPQNERAGCKGFAHAAESLHWVENAGAWETCAAQAILGIRKRPRLLPSMPETTDTTPRNNNIHSLATLRARLRNRERTGRPSSRDNDDWEAYTMSTSGDFYTTPLHAWSTPADELDPLLVASAGPICKLGARSVAVGFGNGIKVVALGHERFEEETNGVEGARVGYIGSVNRRVRQHRKAL